jgi:hypothetical protein
MVFPEDGQREGQHGKCGGLMMVIELRGRSNCVAVMFLLRGSLGMSKRLLW